MKYKLTEKFEHDTGTVYQIQALKDFGNVKAGDLGGWVESEKNLSQEGNCWIYDDTWVSDTVEVFGNVRIGGNVRISGDGWIR